MALVRVNGTLIGEAIGQPLPSSREWRGACGCMLGAVTAEVVVIRPSRRIYRVRRPLPTPIEAVCYHGIEHRLTEEDACRLVPR
jgi:hypothetical protein